MRLLVHDYVGHAFPVQLSRQLSAMGHEVLHLHFPAFEAPKGDLSRRLDDPPTFQVTGLQIKRQYKKYSFISRYFAESEYSDVCAEAISAFKPQAVLSGGASPSIQNRLLKRCRRDGIPFILWLQDVYGVAAHRVLSRQFGPLGWLLAAQVARTEQAVLAGSQQVVYISEDFTSIDLAGRKLPAGTVIENWAPLESLPELPKSNPWSRSHGLDDKRVLLYSGTLGLKHNPSLILQTALHFRHQADVRVVVVSQGLGRQWLEAEKKREKLDNLLLYDYEPNEMFANVIATADVLLAIIEPDAGIFSVPSKILSYFCAGRPMVLAVPEENLAARTVARSKSGLVVQPQDVRAFVSACSTLLTDRRFADHLAHNGRRYAEATFDIRLISRRFEALFRDAFDRSQSGKAKTLEFV